MLFIMNPIKQRTTIINEHDILHINIDEIDLYYQLHKDKIDKNRDYYLSYIRERPELYNDYRKLCDLIYESDKHQQQGIKQGVRRHFIDPSGQIIMSMGQNGGGSGILTACLVLGSFVLSGVVAFMMWYFLNSEEDCKLSYPLYPIDKIPDVASILEKILPGSWIKKGIEEGKDAVTVINESGQYLETMANAFDILDESSGSTAKQVLTSSSKIVLSIGAAVVTAGAGGDKIVNIPFFITKAIKMTTKTFNKLRKVTVKITKKLQELSSALKKVQASVEQVIMTVETLEKNKVAIENSLRNNKHQIAFIYDLFNVDFSGGPVHCKCWVEFIMKHYISSNERLKEIYMLLCVINDIYLDINKEIIGFIGSALDMVIPESMGLAGTIAPLLDQYSYQLYRHVRGELTNNYYRYVPLDARNLIQNPLSMKKYISNKLNTYTLGASSMLIPDQVQQYMDQGLDVLATGLHKGMSMMFMFLNVFIIFSELNQGVNTVMINQNINVEMLLNDCVFCGEFNVNGINQDGTLNLEDKTNCMRCKKFYLDDETIAIDDNLMYAKCMAYKDKRDQAKVAYNKLKKITMDANKGKTIKLRKRIG